MPNPSAAILKAASDLAEIVRASGVDLRPDGTDWIGRCPYHNDTEPSFHVYAGDDPHYHCFGCGSHGDVIDFVQKSEGLDFKAAVAKLAEGAGIEVENRQNGRPSRYQTVAIYEYTDRAGELVYKIERRETENGDKRFVCKPKGVVRERGTLYRLPELVDGDDPVVVCEGEKCVDTLVELGITATCNPLGAGKWRDSYSETLRGRDVIVWPDNDEPGRKHANEVCAGLRAVAASVRIVEPPDYLGVGGDVVDVLQAHDETEVRRQIESATLRKPEDTTGDQNASRPSICAGSADLAVTVDAAWEALEAYNKPTRLLRFGSAVVVLEEDETEIIVAPQSADALRVQLSRAARWFSVKNQSGERIEYDAYPPLPVARGMLAGDTSRLPLLRRLIRAPIMAPSGRIVEREGYDDETRCWLVTGMALPAIPERPSTAQVRAARQLIAEDFLGEFPFVDAADIANTLALVLLPFARELIDGPTPLHLVEKPSPGSGASLLLEVFGVLVRGRPPTMLTEAKDEDEWRKRITSTLLGAPEIIVIDNLRRRLDSAAFSAVLTARTWEDRRLGGSSNVSLPVRCVWAATGNNPAVSSEIARRSVSIRIDPRIDRPWERTGFRHPQLVAWTTEHRAELIGAVLTLVQAWHVAGRPNGDAFLGSYESWAAVMGGILQVAEIDGFLANRVRFYDRADRETAAWTAFIGAWHEGHGDTAVGAKDLWDLFESVDPPCDLGRGSERSQRTRLGEALASAIDRRYTVDGQHLRIEGAGTRKRAAQYRLVPE